MASSTSEETPLLQDVQKLHEQVYQRFSPARKNAILVMVSLTGLMPPFVSGTFTPLIPQVSKDLNASAALVSLAVSIAIFATSIGSMIGSCYSTLYGRRPIYLLGIPMLIIASFGVAASRTIHQLLFWRFFQAMGSSPGLTIGSAVIGDIYKLEERGAAMGIFFGALLLGLTLAPVAGGVVAHYSSWRTMQQAVGVWGIGVFVYMYYAFPETFHPGQRGVDKMDPGAHPKWRPVILNPLKPLWMLRSPNLLFVSTAAFTGILADYVLQIPIAYTIGVKYGITNEALIGACFIPAGVGNVLGAIYAGRLSDKMVIKWRAKRNGVWYAEDRLRVTIPGALYYVPLSNLMSGIFVTYVDGPVGLTLNLFCLFLNGFGVDVVLGPSAAYFVDSMHSRSAEAMAAYSGFRQVLTALTVSLIIPMVEKYGVLATDTSSALLAWIGWLLLWITIQHGDRLRAVVDVGFSTAADN
ncbi:major facilitator superfamily domain-containing protein [Crepidotus variabilis]|uniref:Major facilitator superfamily domain-containing protein n=1 Tax=Crepidotus variabilis TaxID=179855 RepID=A0A9P6JQ57_9AGAR|nr:major facilitator superfamily domain-containing protein [Crepidotus variabilis]